MQLAFPIATYHDRLARVRGAISGRELDALIVTTPDSIFWLTGFDTIGYLWSQALVIDTTSAEPTLITRTSERPGVSMTSWLREPRIYDITLERAAQVIAQTVRDRGLDGARIGIDLQAFTLVPAVWEELRAALPDVTWTDASDLVAEERLVKEPAEITYQLQAAAMADYAMTRVIEAVRPGVSETELAGVASLALGEAGSEYGAIPPMVVSGERTALVHALASRRTVARGDLVCVELAGVVHRYHAILMRTISVGEPSERVREVESCLVRGFEAALAECKPGAAVPGPDHACNAVLAELDLVPNRCHRIGYSLGVAYPPGWLEPMTLVDGDPHVFQPDITFSLEPNLTLPADGFGLKLGETVRCTSDGARRMSTLDPGITVV